MMEPRILEVLVKRLRECGFILAQGRDPLPLMVLNKLTGESQSF